MLDQKRDLIVQTADVLNNCITDYERKHDAVNVALEKVTSDADVLANIQRNCRCLYSNLIYARFTKKEKIAEARLNQHIRLYQTLKPQLLADTDKLERDVAELVELKKYIKELKEAAAPFTAVPEHLG